MKASLFALAFATLALASTLAWNSEVDFGAQNDQPKHVSASRRDATPAHFTYDGEDGPAHWGTLDGAYSTCDSGLEQSPINLPVITNGNADDIEIKWPDLVSPVSVSNNGHAFQVSVATNANGGAKSYVTYKGKQYFFLQFHFHGPSEHHVNGRHFPLEFHAVHKSADNQLLVVGILLNNPGTGNAATKFFSALRGAVPSTKSTVTISKTINLNSLLSKVTKDFWAYSGSLTTPPCTEGVQWIVAKKPVAVTQSFLNEISAKIGFNSRFTMDENNRFAE